MEVIETSCCGMGEMSEIREDRNAREVLDRLIEASVGCSLEWDPVKLRYVAKIPKFEGLTYGQYIFSQATWPKKGIHAGAKRKYGESLARLIRKEKLGRVVTSAVGVNPNHTDPPHSLKVFVWTPDQDRFNKYAATRIKLIKKRDESGEGFF